MGDCEDEFVARLKGWGGHFLFVDKSLRTKHILHFPRAHGGSYRRLPEAKSMALPSWLRCHDVKVN